MKPSYIIAALVLVIVAMIFFWPQPQDGKIEELKRSIAVADQEIKELTVERSTLLNEVRQDSVRHASEQAALKTQANAFKREVERLKASPLVIRVREENLEVDSLIVKQDSIIVNQGHRIAAYEHQLSKLQVNMAGIIKNFEGQIALERERFEAQEQLTIASMKEVKRQKRKKVRNTILGGLAGIAIGFFLK